jgi:hypothetical protein
MDDAPVPRPVPADRDPRHPIPARAAAAAGGYALGIWAAATALIVALGDLLLPPADRASAALAYAIAAVASALVGHRAARHFMRRAGRDVSPPVAGLLVGAAIALVGLTLDGVLVGALGHGYPGVGAERADTIVVGLLLGHAAALAGAAAAGVAPARHEGGGRREQALRPGSQVARHPGA